MGRWHYPRWRRILMQVVLCSILAASVGLAAVVTHHRQLVGSTQLAGLRWFGLVGVRAPAGWALESENQGSILLVAQEPDAIDPVEKQGRHLTVRGQQLDAVVSAQNYLKSSGMVPGNRRMGIDGIELPSPEPITIAGSQGILQPVIVRVGISLFSPPVYQTQWIACVVRPTGLAIVLQLGCPDNSDSAGDRQTAREIAGAIQVRDPVSNK